MNSLYALLGAFPRIPDMKAEIVHGLSLISKLSRSKKVASAKIALENQHNLREAHQADSECLFQRGKRQ